MQPHRDEILCTKQHGFRKHLSCATQLVTVDDELTSYVDRKAQVHAVFLNFSIAFDLVPQDILIGKLLNLGLDCGLIRWVANFLNDRTRRVVLEGQSHQMHQ